MAGKSLGLGRFVINFAGRADKVVDFHRFRACSKHTGDFVTEVVFALKQLQCH